MGRARRSHFPWRMGSRAPERIAESFRARGPAWLGASLGLLLAACGSRTAPFRVEVATAQPPVAWLEDSHLEERTLAVSRVAAGQWGGAELDGWTIRFVADIERCGSATSSAQPIMGCTHHDSMTIELRVDARSPCVEGTALIHEIGHVVVPNDPDHRDPRWSDGGFWYDMLSAVQGEIGGRDALCAEVVAAWQQWWRARAG